MSFQESSQSPGISLSFCPFPCHFYASFQELLNHLKILPNYIKFELKYQENRKLFKDSLETPVRLPLLAEIEWFWLKRNEKTFKEHPKNITIIKESTFIVWLISIFEELHWEKPFFKLVILSK